MKIKSLILSALLFPASLFAATNAIDNLTVATSLKNNGSFYSTNSAITNTLSTSMFLPRGASGDYVLFSDSGSTVIGSVQTNAFLGFSIGTTNNGPKISFRASTGLIMITNASFEVTGNTTLDGSVTFGDAAADTLTWNAGTSTMIGGHNFNANTMFVTNGGVAFGTNLILTTETVRIQGGSGANATALTVVEGPAGSAVPIQAWKAANGTTGMQVISNASALLIGAAQYTVVGVNLLNASGDASVVNNTASTGATLSLGAGTGSGTRVLIKAGGTTVGNFSTNQVNLNGINFSATTNSTLMGPFLSVKGSVIPGSIAANVTYVTNFALANSVTNGAYMPILPPFFENVNLTYQVGCPSNGFVQIYIHNEDLISAHTGSNGTYGVTGIMPSL